MRTYYWILFILLFTLSFLFESFLAVVTVGLYLFVPDKHLIGNKLKRWHIKKQLQLDFANNPEKLQEIEHLL